MSDYRPELKIAPSLLASDFANIERELKRLEDAGADYHHVDVMDGHFVPNLTIGAPIVAWMKRYAKLPLDCHLMITDPLLYIEDFARAGADLITIHLEAASPLQEAFAEIRKCNKRVGLALNPGTPVEDALSYLAEIDMLLIMSVWPGFGGQAFIEQVLEKVRIARSHAPELDIEIDGGINAETAAQAREAGANVLVAGSYVFKGQDLRARIESLRA